MKFYKYLPIFLLITFTVKIFGQFQNVSSPYGHEVYSFGVGKNVMLTNSGGKVFLSTNSGDDWIRPNKGIPSSIVFSFFSTKSKIFAVTNMGLLISTDNGYDWSLSNNGVPVFVYSMAKSDSILFLGSEEGLYISTDQGVSWIPRNEGLPIDTVVLHLGDGPDTVYDVAISKLYYTNNQLYAETGYMTKPDRILVSKDFGKSWKQLDSTVYNIQPLYFDVDSNKIAMEDDGNLIISRDFGQNWFKSKVGYGLYIACLKIIGQKIFIGTNEGLFYSKDDSTWIHTGSDTTLNEVTSILASDSEIFAGTYNNGIYKASEKNLIWESACKGIDGISITTFYVFRNNLFAFSNGYLYKFNQLQNRWYSTKSGLQIFAVGNDYSVYTNDSTVYVASGELYMQRNLGDWLSVTSEVPACITITGNGSNLFAGTNGEGVYLSSDEGTSWHALIPGEKQTHVKYIYADKNEFFYIADGYLYRYVRNDSNWSKSNLKSYGHVNSVCIKDSEIFDGTDFGVYFSNDKGLTWSKRSNGLPDSSYVYKLYNFNNKIFAAVSDYYTKSIYNFFYTTNDGNNWQKIDTSPIGNQEIYSIIGFDSTLFLSSGSGTWKVGLNNIITAVPIGNSQIIRKMILYQNYPNPFNPSTIINYDIPRSGIVTLKIYDVLGRLVKTLVNKYESRGEHNITFNGTNLASGVYFYRLRESNFVSTKKMLLLK